MLIGILHKGSGLGDQLFSYIATRVRAADLGVDFGFVGKEFFKGAGFMNLDWGKEPILGGVPMRYWIKEETGELKIGDIYKNNQGDHLRIFKCNADSFDPNFNFIKDDEVIDGYGAQDIRYFEHRLDEVSRWLKIKPRNFGKNECVVNLRGGEYKTVPDLYLSKEYWDKAIEKMLEIDKDMFFEIVTDDVEEAKRMFPIDGNKFRVSHEIGSDWQMIRYSPYLIISNSAFAILPALLNENVKEVIAPKYWAGRNVGEWRRPGNYYKKFTYI